jgi:hypothetical protein
VIDDHDAETLPFSLELEFVFPRARRDLSDGRCRLRVNLERQGYWQRSDRR